MSQTSIPASTTTLQAANWSGYIPILLSLAPSSLSSPVAPRPLHRMISRMTYLHIALNEEVMQLFEFAPATAGQKELLVREEPPDDDDNHKDESICDSGEASASDGAVAAASDDKSNDAIRDKSGQNETDQKDIEQKADTAESTGAQPISKKYPTCWFEDEESGQPLRWHLFIGVLYDAMKGRAVLKQSHSFCPSDESATLLPWRIRVHFTSYPPTILPFEIQPPSKKDTTVEHTNQISTTISRTFRNSLKQALFMQYTSSKVANSITKSSHEKMWNAILTTNYTLYHEVNGSLQMGTLSSEADKQVAGAAVPELIPVRVLVNGNSPMQRPCRAFRDADENIMLQTIKQQCETEENGEETTEDEKTLDNLVERLTTCSIRPQTSLGNVLLSWLPQYFDVVDETIVAKSFVYYSIQGIQPNLSCSILDLWRSLCHPDHFLYVVVITND
ncbi:hypothetical protein ACHAWO_009129 [Cyclotella atomus]|uniref:Autophagy protein 5 n=1 Tax=Cyclotella atomus TaxID=382360 RepID=A0ABD3PPJ8_9STRA